MLLMGSSGVGHECRWTPRTVDAWPSAPARYAKPRNFEAAREPLVVGGSCVCGGMKAAAAEKVAPPDSYGLQPARAAKGGKAVRKDRTRANAQHWAETIFATLFVAAVLVAGVLVLVRI